MLLVSLNRKAGPSRPWYLLCCRRNTFSLDSLRTQDIPVQQLGGRDTHSCDTATLKGQRNLAGLAIVDLGPLVDGRWDLDLHGWAGVRGLGLQ